MFDRLPKKFTEVISVAFSEEGKIWIQSLPKIIFEIEENWKITVGKPFSNLSYHFVAPCICADGSQAVLKIGFPGEAENILNEVRTLQFLDGKSIVRLLRFDEKRFALLLEKLTPGENLKTIFQNNENEAVETATSVMTKFWRNIPEKTNFPTLEIWFAGLKKAEKINFAPNYTKKSEIFFEELTKIKQSILLHGDFHHENILSAAREPFLAIDPKGIVGNIGFDISVFLINHAHWLKNSSNLQQKLNEAIARFSDAFNIKQIDLRKWVFAFSVLSAWWTFEEHSDNWKNELDFTEIWEV